MNNNEQHSICSICGCIMYVNPHTCPTITLSDYGPYRQKVTTKDGVIIFDYTPRIYNTVQKYGTAKEESTDEQ
jgi:hypothetical protein